jgi:hypothetical protein
LELCKDYRRDLIGVRNQIIMLDHTREQLDRIVDVVNNYEADEW